MNSLKLMLSASAQPLTLQPCNVNASSKDKTSQSEPATRVKVLFSLFAVVQLGTLSLSLLSNYAPSFLQGELLTWCSPYIVTTHQMFGAKPLELTHSESIDFPVQIDVQLEGNSDWTTVTFGRDALNKTRWPMLARIMTVIADEDRENEILAEVTSSLAQQINSTRRKKVRRIRLIQPHVISFDEDSFIQEGKEELLGEIEDASQVFAADVVYDEQTNVIGVLPILSKFRTSPATKLP